MSDEPVVALGSAVLVIGRKVIRARVDFARDPGVLPPIIDGGDEDAVGVEEAGVEHRLGQVRAKDQDPQVSLCHRPDAVADLCQRRTEQGGTSGGPA